MVMNPVNDEALRARVEALGPAERILQTLLTYADHMVHNRPGIVKPAPGSTVGVHWAPVLTRQEDGGRAVYRLDKRGNKSVRTKIGMLAADGNIRDGAGKVVGQYRMPGLFPEVAAWLYGQVAEVYKLDNDFAARWASWALTQDHRDLKVVLAAFMLVQTRAGEAVVEDGEVLFHDDDFRAVGEAMCLLRRKDGKDINPKMLLRVGDLLALPVVADVNRALGFGRSARNPAMGRYPKAVTKWLRFREDNPRMLQGLVKAGYRKTVMKLAQRVGYKPNSPKFFEILRWKQKQAKDGRRNLAIGQAVAAAATWEGLTEAQICGKIVAERPSYKRIVGMVPADIGITRAIMAAAVEANVLSDADLIILTPTLEDLNLLNVPVIATRWTAACERAENARAANIAKRVKTKAIAEKLEDAADTALKKAVEEVVRGLHVYFAVDISGSMTGAIDQAKAYLTKFLQGFPLDKLTVCVFNTKARKVEIKHASAKGVAHAFKGFRAGGGTSYGSAVRQVFADVVPAPDEDALMFFVGDQGQYGTFTDAVRASGLNPVAFGLLDDWHCGSVVEDTAVNLGIPCFTLDAEMFGDTYAVSRTLRNLIASTPVKSATRAGKPARVSLVETILKTKLLAKPVWA